MELLKISALIFFGGGLGSVTRYSLSQVQAQMIPERFPTGTLLANILACVILGIILFITKDKIAGSLWVKYFLVIGFCGGFSTFSTFGLETVQLVKGGHLALATANVLVSLVLSFIILWLFTRT